MSVFDSTAVNLAASGGTPALPTGGEKPPADGNPALPGSPPAGTELVTGLLAKHNLSSPEELAEFIDGLSAKAGKIGNLDPEELVKSHETLTAYHKEWAKQEREKLKASEKPEDTIARLEKELQAEDRRKARAEGESRKVETAKQALATWDNAVTNTITSDPSIPAEYHDFFKSFMGVNNPINAADPSDRAKAVKLTKEFGIPAMRKFEQAVIARYRAGKIEIPAVPPPSTGEPPVLGEKAPKTQSERRALAHTLFSRILGNK
jgi:hypothetical protein